MVVMGLTGNVEVRCLRRFRKLGGVSFLRGEAHGKRARSGGSRAEPKSQLQDAGVLRRPSPSVVPRYSRGCRRF